ncbi:methyltransferase domain-containing protein [bacterium]|nr:methyltransferase domain-containing protein [bacterium]
MCGIIISKMNYFDRARYFRTKKRLGQNFLVDGEVIQDIIDFAQITPDDTVLEIGPGVGFVTEQLVKHAKKVIAIELDEEAIAELKKLEAPNLEIIHNDVLKTDLSNLTNEKFKVVANIPYYITSPIIAHLLGEIDDLAKIIAIADVYDAMTANRCYRKGLCPFEVIATFEKEGLVKYDSKYILTFLNRIIDTYICNSVLLNDGTCGKIVLMNQKALSRPVIHTITNEYIDLTKHPELYIQAII